MHSSLDCARFAVGAEEVLLLDQNQSGRAAGNRRATRTNFGDSG